MSIFCRLPKPSPQAPLICVTSVGLIFTCLCLITLGWHTSSQERTFVSHWWTQWMRSFHCIAHSVNLCKNECELVVIFIMCLNWFSCSSLEFELFVGVVNENGDGVDFVMGIQVYLSNNALWTVGKTISKCWCWEWTWLYIIMSTS